MIIGSIGSGQKTAFPETGRHRTHSPTHSPESSCATRARTTMSHQRRICLAGGASNPSRDVACSCRGDNNAGHIAPLDKTSRDDRENNANGYSAGRDYTNGGAILGASSHEKPHLIFDRLQLQHTWFPSMTTLPKMPGQLERNGLSRNYAARVRFDGALFRKSHFTGTLLLKDASVDRYGAPPRVLWHSSLSTC
jgi:hypothetical protein